jgi:DNA-binding winged helix-turn-helix (wHTH) protein
LLITKEVYRYMVKESVRRYVKKTAHALLILTIPGVGYRFADDIESRAGVATGRSSRCAD